MEVLHLNSSPRLYCSVKKIFGTKRHKLLFLFLERLLCVKKLATIFFLYSLFFSVVVSNKYYFHQ